METKPETKKRVKFWFTVISSAAIIATGLAAPFWVKHAVAAIIEIAHVIVNNIVGN